MPEDRIWVDPGIGFGKTVDHNLALIARLDEIAAIGRTVVIGVSRKSFLGQLTGRAARALIAGTIAANVMAMERGARSSACTTWRRWVTRCAWPLLRSARGRARRARRRRGPRPGRGRPVRIEIAGLSLYTHHGVGQAEREVGQRLVLDVALEVDDRDAAVTDRLEDTIDYGEVCQEVALAAQARSYLTLERLCSAVADRLIDRYGADSVTVRAAKPEPDSAAGGGGGGGADP